MKRALVGSERLSGVYSEDFEICNAYGLSETLGGVCAFLVDKKVDNTPIGKPLEGVVIRLLDEDGNAVPEGAEGEICLQGHFADGYLNMPEATAAAFIKQPDGTVLFHTGDTFSRFNQRQAITFSRLLVSILFSDRPLTRHASLPH